jgi:hypothetical protein
MSLSSWIGYGWSSTYPSMVGRALWFQCHCRRMEAGCLRVRHSVAEPGAWVITPMGLVEERRAAQPTWTFR